MKTSITEHNAVATTVPDLPYFPRPELTDRILATARSGLVPGITMFAPRRKGKTWFLTRELLPAFENHGWNALCIDLWRRRADPEQGLVELLEEAAPPPKAAKALARTRKVKLGATVLGSGGQVEVSKDAPADVSLEKRLEDALARLLVSGRPVLLALDEFQTLAGAKRIGFVSSLRANLQRYQGRLFPIFTGSSRTALNAMFKSAKAPLFQSTTTVPFPDLGMDFILDRVRLLKERTPKLKLDAKAFHQVFESLGHSPQFANEMILQALVDNTADMQVIYDHWLQSKAEGEDFPGVLAGLKPLQAELLVLMATMPRKHGENRGLYSEAVIKQLQRKLPGETITAPRIQTALKRLQSLQLIASEAGVGEYEIEDASLKAYLRQKIPANNKPRV